MKFLKSVLILNLFLFSHLVQAKGKEMSRAERASEVYRELFQSERTVSATDPEFMEILQKNIFGDVFDTGKLSHKERELITVAALTAIQTLPQLKAHINAALNTGNTPLEIRETIYGCAPYIGFPRTLNAIGIFNEVMSERGIKLPLENTATATDATRHEKGLEIQTQLYGDEVKKAMSSLPGIYKNAVPNTLTDFCFGDFYTRKGLPLKQRELLSLVILTALGAEKQLSIHVIGALKAGNDKETLLSAMMQAAPYIGLPNALTTINLIKAADIKDYKPIYE